MNGKLIFCFITCLKPASSQLFHTLPGIVLWLDIWKYPVGIHYYLTDLRWFPP